MTMPSLVARAILACFFLTAGGTVGVWYLRENTSIEELISPRDDRFNVVNLIEALVAETPSMTIEGMRSVAENVARRDPRQVRNIAQGLLNEGSEEAWQLGTLIAEAGADFHGWDYLKVRAGIGYSHKYFMDYEKAIKFLSDPEVIASPSVKYRLGQLYLDENNKFMSTQRGLDLIRLSAEQGYEPAMRFQSALVDRDE